MFAAAAAVSTVWIVNTPFSATVNAAVSPVDPVIVIDLSLITTLSIVICSNEELPVDVIAPDPIVPKLDIFLFESRITALLADAVPAVIPSIKFSSVAVAVTVSPLIANDDTSTNPVLEIFIAPGIVALPISPESGIMILPPICKSPAIPTPPEATNEPLVELVDEVVAVILTCWAESIVMAVVVPIVEPTPNSNLSELSSNPTL